MNKKDNNSFAYKAALGGILCAQALAISWLESLLPAFPFMPPGAKPGLSNIITMFAAGELGLGYAVTITVLKALFALITRGATAGAMSFAGGILSTLVMWLLLRYCIKKIGLTGISVLCALSHNAGQLAAAMFITGTKSVIYYAPFMGLYAAAAGAVTGVILKAVMPALQKQEKFFIRHR